MKTFKDFLEEKEEKDFDTLNENAGEVIGKILGFATYGVFAAYGGTLLILAGAKSYQGLRELWDKIKASLHETNPKIFFKKINSNKLVKQETEKAEENKKQYSDILGDVYQAIDKKDFVETKEKFAALSPQYRNMPEIKQVIINEITKVLKEPPLWPPSPGNTTYKAIRNVLGLPEAKAAAMAVKYHTAKTMEEKTVE